MTTILLFLGSFVVVFSIGLQTLMVTRFRYAGAFITSLVISIAQLALFKLGPAAAGIEIVGMVMGGPLGIVSAMFIYRCTRK